MAKGSKISYEPEADVLTLEMSKEAPIDFAREMGNVIVHFTSNNVPVLVEILEASSFASTVQDLLKGKSSGVAEKPAAA